MVYYCIVHTHTHTQSTVQYENFNNLLICKRSGECHPKYLMVPQGAEAGLKSGAGSHEAPLVEEEARVQQSSAYAWQAQAPVEESRQPCE